MTTQLKDEAVVAASGRSSSDVTSSHDVDSQKNVMEKQNPEAGSVTVPTSTKDTPFDRDWRFWMIMFTLAIGSFLVSIENTVVITSLPTIVKDLRIGSNYIWISNAFFLTRYFSPLLRSSHN